MKKLFLCVLACILHTLFGMEVQATLRLPAIISDNMVIQSDAKITLWGWALPNEQIEVTPSWSKKAYATRTNKDGRWMVQIRTPKGSGTEMEILFATAAESKTVAHVLVGEVWLCSGQSNMDFPVAKSTGWRTGILDEESEMKDANYPEIRFFHVAQRLSADKELEDCSGEWKIVSPTNLTDFSAIAFFYGRKLYQNLRLPVGLIQSTWGGTHAESWTKMAVMQENPLYKDLLQAQQQAKEEYPTALLAYEQQLVKFEQAKLKDPTLKAPSKPQDPNNNKTLSTLWNGMIYPLVPYTIKGVLWYQGESNAVRAGDYRQVFENMIKSWRNEWKQGDFPFYFVQIAPHYKQPPEIREAQLKASQTIQHTGMVVITDVGDSTDIHPRNKKVPGERLADLALGKSYGKKVLYSGPVFQKATFGKGDATLYFDQVADGLQAAEGGALVGFELAGKDGVFFPAKASIDRKLVMLHTDKVQNPVYIRYGWGKFFRANLANSAGLPASPFRTDQQ
ncbi:sialate O-acetylesterase [Sphingobacterium sp. LRF_L2]|uniref:sialate O-acetylesterase n=1 Tax=Sphingobacterium sp. LRF_L2 TaxID=3369421 RepID=UPI003F637DE8